MFGKDNDFIPSHGVVFAIEASMTANDNDPNIGDLLKVLTADYADEMDYTD